MRGRSGRNDERVSARGHASRVVWSRVALRRSPGFARARDSRGGGGGFLVICEDTKTLQYGRRYLEEVG